MTSMTVLLIATVVIALGFQVFGREKIMDRVFGSPDLGRTDFSTLKRPWRKNHCLACPKDFCTHTKPDLEPKIYAMSADQLRDALRKVLQKERRLERVHTNDPIMRERYIQRSEIYRFPDTIQVEYIPIDSEHSTLAIYSRSKLGIGDGGVNRARVKRWLRSLDEAVK